MTENAYWLFLSFELVISLQYNVNYSLKVSLAIGHLDPFGHMECTTMICLSDLQTLSSIPVCNCPMPKLTFIPGGVLAEKIV